MGYVFTKSHLYCSKIRTTQDFFVTESGGKFESIISTPKRGKITPSNYNLHDLHSAVKVPSINWRKDDNNGASACVKLETLAMAKQRKEKHCYFSHINLTIRFFWLKLSSNIPWPKERVCSNIHRGHNILKIRTSYKNPIIGLQPSISHQTTLNSRDWSKHKRKLVPKREMRVVVQRGWTVEGWMCEPNKIHAVLSSLMSNGNCFQAK